MITRKDQLLKRPWEERRFDNHRRKVQSASAAIDNKSPVPRQHVTLKLKKKQKETERIEEIEKNNFLLLRKMNHIMKTSRVDNHWTTPPPNFLNRISMYDTSSLITMSDQKKVELFFHEPEEKSRFSRKEKCLACTPQIDHGITIPEERIPWAPEKPPVARKRSQSVPVRKLEIGITVKPTRSADSYQRSKMVKQKPVIPKSTKEAKQSPQSIILSRGCLKLSVNFPSDTFVQFKEGKQEKILMKGSMCNCKNAPIFSC